MSEAREVRTEHPVDLLVMELQRLRAAAGSPSYAEIAQRVARRRRADGASEAAARVSKTTVYSVFQTGRRRLNVDLVEEMLLTLGADHAVIASWKERYAEAQLPTVSAAVVVEEEAPEELVVAPADLLVHARRYVVPLVLACSLALNLFGGWFVMVTRLPVYLDMVGTAIASTVLGPWWGVLVAIGTNGGETVYDGRASLPFVVVNMAGALVWGYGVRRFGMGRSLARFFMLNVAVALSCTVIAVPILLGDFSGVTRNAVSDQTLTLAATYHSLLAGVWSSNTLTSLIDKMLCGVGVLLGTSRLPASHLTRMPRDWMVQARGDGVSTYGETARRMIVRIANPA
ncbi:energy-coupling factor transport system substrate-specific component [Jatrophihabitans endophyticus]|uniref:Energy-coupling factor transport system substrate-specific component n=1 Tax=Jatrophihabitans endophyticus TaxID=1206085 RepID=A0A1M5HBA4_9ACTN|nr:hypothetical protein [Jatrophihabitans endophyticus]SHG13072.1 energy-coupling factor transport system substrate-specific component [Jatrophihabitans endophyticus]